MPATTPLISAGPREGRGLDADLDGDVSIVVPAFAGMSASGKAEAF